MGIAIYATRVRLHHGDACLHWSSEGVAHLVPVVCGGNGAGVRLPILFRPSADTRTQGTSAQCNCTQFYSVQSRAGDWTIHSWNRAGHVGCGVVLFTEWDFVLRGDCDALHHSSQLCATTLERTRYGQHETGNSIYWRSRRDEGRDSFSFPDY